MMKPHDGAVDEHVLEVGIGRQLLENALEHAVERPSSEALEHRVPQPERLWQVAPWRAGASNPQDRFEEFPIVSCGPSGVAVLSG